MRRVGTVHLFAEGEPVKGDDIPRFQLPPDQVVRQVQVQLSLGDAITGKLA